MSARIWTGQGQPGSERGKGTRPAAPRRAAPRRAAPRGALADQRLERRGKGGSRAYPLLESGNLVVRQRVRLGDDGDQVDLGVQASHDLDVERLQGVAGGLDEVDARVHAVVDDVHPVDLVLGVEVGVEALVDVVDDGPPRLVVVDEIAEAGRVDDGQPQPHAVLLDVGADGLDRDGLGDDLGARALLRLGRVQRRVEESVDEGRFSETGLACNDRASTYFVLPQRASRPGWGSVLPLPFVSPLDLELHVPTTMTLKLKPLRTLLRCH